MKATDLMIGDWVQLPDSAGRVVSIAKNGIYFESELGEGVCTFDHLQPIPLTPEILEKNGWKIWYGDEKKKCPMYATWMADTSIMFEFYFHEGILREYWASDEAFATFPAGMNYLHQLQHALRLCGIEKEVVV